MNKDDVLEWSVQRIPLFRFINWEGRRIFSWVVIIFFVLCFVIGINVIVKTGDFSGINFILMLALSICAVMLVAIIFAMLVMRAVGCGYSYRLDNIGLTFQFSSGWRRESAESITDYLGAESVSLGLFRGWVQWVWLRDHGYGMETNENYEVILLRNQTGHCVDGEIAQTIYVFCASNRQFTEVKQFIGDRLTWTP